MLYCLALCYAPKSPFLPGSCYACLSFDILLWPSSSSSSLLLMLFFFQVEFRGSLSLEHEATKKAYGLLHRTASELCAAVKEDFPNAAQVAPRISF